MQLLMEKRINFAKAKELLKLGDNDRIAEAAVYAVKKGMNIAKVFSAAAPLLTKVRDVPTLPVAPRSTPLVC